MQPRKRLRVTNDNGVETIAFVTSSELHLLRSWLGARQNGSFRLLDLPDDLAAHLLRFLGLRDVARLARTCRALHGLCDTPCAKEVVLPTSTVLPLPPVAEATTACARTYAVNAWRSDFALLRSILLRPRLSRIVLLTLRIDSPSLASPRCLHAVPRARFEVASPPARGALPHLRKVALECDPRRCGTVSSCVMRRLLPMFWAARHVVFENVSNLGISHFVGLEACVSITHLELRNCRASPPLCDQRRLLDGSLLRKLTNLKRLSFDVRNASYAMRLLNGAERALFYAPTTSRVTHLKLPRNMSPLVETLDRLLATHPHMRQLWVNRKCSGVLREMEHAGMHADAFRRLTVVTYT